MSKITTYEDSTGGILFEGNKFWSSFVICASLEIVHFTRSINTLPMSLITPFIYFKEALLFLFFFFTPFIFFFSSQCHTLVDVFYVFTIVYRRCIFLYQNSVHLLLSSDVLNISWTKFHTELLYWTPIQGKYKVYNLCSERLYDASLFEGKVCCLISTFIHILLIPLWSLCCFFLWPYCN